MSNISEKLAELQIAMKVPKGKTNQSMGGFAYRTAEDILEVAKQRMPDGCSIVSSDELILIGERYYVQTTSSFSDGEHGISAKGLAQEGDYMARKGLDAAQVTGLTASYALKRALGNLLAISGEPDSDSRKNWDREVAQYHKLIKKARAHFDSLNDSEAASIPCMDVYLFTVDLEPEDKKDLYFSYIAVHALKGQKGKLSASIKELGDKGRQTMEIYRDALIAETDEYGIKEIRDELNAEQLKIIDEMIELELATGKTK